MTEYMSAAGGADAWAPPSDRQLALRARLGAGWSVHSAGEKLYQKRLGMSSPEQDHVLSVLERAQKSQDVEKLRIGRLFQRLENMKLHALGDGVSQCGLCGEQFGRLGTKPPTCAVCHKGVCSKCGLFAPSRVSQNLWLCKLCAETREFWKRSNAWFFKEIPPYTVPPKAATGRPGRPVHSTTPSRTENRKAGGGAAQYNTWSKAREDDTDEDFSDYKPEVETSSDEPHARSRHGTRGSSESEEGRPECEQLQPLSVSSQQLAGSKTSLVSGQLLHGLGSATESLRDEAMHDSGSESLASGHIPGAKEPESIDAAFSRYGSGGGQKASTPVMKKRTVSPPKSDSTEVLSEDDSDTTLLGSLEFSLHYDAAQCTLHVCIQKARGLRAMDANGYSDPYVKLHLLPGSRKSTKLRTRTCFKTLNPEWNETLIYHGITQDDMEKRILRLSVLDEDRFGFDFLGEYRVNLRTISPAHGKSFNAVLERQLPKAELEKLEDNDELLSSERGRLLLGLQYSIQRQALLVSVVRCANLAPCDSNGFSDPFVKLYLKPDPDKSSKQKTSVKKKTLHPEYNEDFTYAVTLPDLAKRTLEVTVWDRDVGRHNDYIGGVQLGINSKGENLKHWFETLKNPNRRFDRWHVLSAQLPPEVL